MNWQEISWIKNKNKTYIFKFKPLLNGKWLVYNKLVNHGYGWLLKASWVVDLIGSSFECNQN